MKKLVQGAVIAGLIAGGASMFGSDGKSDAIDTAGVTEKQSRHDTGIEVDLGSKSIETNRAKTALAIAALTHAEADDVAPIEDTKDSEFFNKEAAQSLRTLFRKGLAGNRAIFDIMHQTVEEKAKELFPTEMRSSSPAIDDAYNQEILANRKSAIEKIVDDLGIPPDRYWNVRNGITMQRSLESIKDAHANLETNPDSSTYRAHEAMFEDVAFLALLNQSYEGNSFSSDFLSSSGLTEEQVQEIAAQLYESVKKRGSSVLKPESNIGNVADFLEAYGIEE